MSGGSVTVEDLKTDGRNVKITESNKAEYIMLRQERGGIMLVEHSG